MLLWIDDGIAAILLNILRCRQRARRASWLLLLLDKIFHEGGYWISIRVACCGVGLLDRLRRNDDVLLLLARRWYLAISLLRNELNMNSLLAWGRSAWWQSGCVDALWHWSRLLYNNVLLTLLHLIRSLKLFYNVQPLFLFISNKNNAQRLYV